MKKKGKVYWLGIGIMFAVSMTLVLGGETAMAAGIKKVIAISASAFAPENDSVVYSYENGYVTGGTEEESACFVAPVVFHKGALRIKKVWVYVHDESEDANGTIEFWRIHLETGINELIGGADTEEASGGVDEYEITIPGNDNKLSDEYAYEIKICISPGILVYGARVKFKN